MPMTAAEVSKRFTVRCRLKHRLGKDLYVDADTFNELAQFFDEACADRWWYRHPYLFGVRVWVKAS